MAGSWGCPHEADDRCGKVNNLPCDPGMKGCVLHGRFVFANDDKNERLRQKQAREHGAGSADSPVAAGAMEAMPPTDDEGYLIDPNAWSEALAVVLAREEDIALTAAHWEAIRFMRTYFQERQVIPDVRFVTRHLAARLNGSRNMIFELFPFGYVKQACRIAGMRRPRGWSTG